ncbi:MAG: filamentous hemagglutinin N-terminal domain-containing protein, partial [Gallionellaceae bacterium]|nr:filamentous hemagglutinin N-terminal domain-containing protein [Gallionellaceae bacterium]
MNTSAASTKSRKQTGIRRMIIKLSRKLSITLTWRPRARVSRLLAMLLAAASAPALALPTAGTVGYGTVSESRTDSTLTVTLDSNKGIIEREGYSVYTGESVVYKMDPSATILERVTGSNPSEIFGSITASGHFFLINPNGTYFGRDAQVNVGSLVTSSLDISNADFIAGRYTFQNGGNAGSVVNQGSLSGKYIALVAPTVDNSGSINANGGTVALAAGDRVSLDISGDGLLNVSVDAAAAGASINHSGAIVADGGKVYITAKSADALMDTVLNVSGLVRAQSLNEQNGVIRLDGGNAGVVAVSGTLDARGGDIAVSGEWVGNTGTISANDGGKIAIDSLQKTVMMSTSVIEAKGGGEVRINQPGAEGFTGARANTSTVMYQGAVIDTTGGADNGFVEVSGAVINVDAGTIKAGAILFDPLNITFSNSNDANVTGFDPSTSDLLEAFSDNSASTSNFRVDGTAGILKTVAAGSTITFQATNNITVSNAFNLKTATTQDNVSLVLTANNNININAAVTGDGTGSITMTANADAAGGGVTDINAASITSGSGGLTINGPVTVSANTTLDSGTGTLSLGSATLDDGVTLTVGTGAASTINLGAVSGTLNGADSHLTINTTGAVTVSGAVGTDFGTVLVTNSGGATFQSTVDAKQITISDTSAGNTVAFQGNTNATTGMTVAAGTGAYNVSLTGSSNTIAGATTFANTGMTTIGDNAGDTTNFTGGVVATAPSSISLNGTVTAAGSGVITLGDADTAVTVSGPSIIGGASTGAITLGAVVLADGVGLTVGTGANTPVQLSSVIGTDGGSAETLLVRTNGSITTTDAIGNGAAGNIATVAMHGNSSASGANSITLGGIIAVAGPNSSIDLRAASIDISGVTLSTNDATDTSATRIALITDALTTDVSTAIDAGTGSFQIAPDTDSANIEVTNGGAQETAYTVWYDLNALPNITAGSVIIGSATHTGAIWLTDQITVAPVNLTLLQDATGGGSIAVQYSYASSDKNLTLTSGTGGIALGGGTDPNTEGDTAGVITLGAGTFTANGDITLEHELSLNANGGVAFNGTIDGAYSLSVGSTGVTHFGDDVGATTALSGLSTDSTGTTTIATGKSITVDNNLTFSDAVSGTDISLTSTGLDVTATNASNDFSGTLSLSGATVSITDSNAIQLGTSSATDLNLTAGGNITQSGALTVSGTTTLTADTNTVNVNLTSNGANNELNTVVFNAGVNGGKYGTVSVTDKDTAVNGLTIGGAGTTAADTDLSTIAGGETVLSGGAYKSLTMQSKGNVSQTGAITVANATTLTADTNTVNVNLTSNGANNELNTVVFNAGVNGGKYGTVSV